MSLWGPRVPYKGNNTAGALQQGEVPARGGGRQVAKKLLFVVLLRGPTNAVKQGKAISSGLGACAYHGQRPETPGSHSSPVSQLQPKF